MTIKNKIESLMLKYVLEHIMKKLFSLYQFIYSFLKHIRRYLSDKKYRKYCDKYKAESIIEKFTKYSKIFLLA